MCVEFFLLVVPFGLGLDLDLDLYLYLCRRYGLFRFLSHVCFLSVARGLFLSLLACHGLDLGLVSEPQLLIVMKETLHAE